MEFSQNVSENSHIQKKILAKFEKTWNKARQHVQDRSEVRFTAGCDQKGADSKGRSALQAGAHLYLSSLTCVPLELI